MDNVSGTLLSLDASLADEDTANVTATFLLDDALTPEEVATLIASIGQRFALIVI